ncbi:PAS domain S-box-containing protein [Panacagrimonas perspica]|uniref:histidine kinase n=1 Tax=Panacagrimonas perspica TaxID=381431 RepID=A0A4V3F687_9GAMM|nr:PAS domain-containing protein [Panacagrimonas perspica]TDU31746.1 PAS domain S-box-containing protein [Panacagrimonas perspica]THD03042.1 hypothetical protein B1810_10610 [Panacagrimonas perspica]
MGDAVGRKVSEPGGPRSLLVTVAVILASTGAAVALHAALVPALENRPTFVPALLGVLIAAWARGGVAGVITGVVTGCVFHWIPVIPATNTIFSTPVDLVRLSLFAVPALAVCGVCAAMHRAQANERQRAAEARLAQQAMADLHQRFELALEAGKMIAWDWDLQSNQIVRSQGAKSSYGLDRDPIERFYDLVHPDDRAGVESAIRSAIDSGTGYEHQFRMQSRDGRTRWLMSRAHVRTNPESGVRHLTGSAVDISDRLQAEQAIRVVQERFEAFMRHFPAAAYIKDDEGRYVFVNTAVEERFGMSAGQIVGLRDADLLGAEHAAHLRTNDLQVLATGKTTEFYETQGPPGKDKTFLTYKFPVHDASGKPLVGGVSLDVTTRVRVERELKDSESRFHKMADSIPQLAWTARRDGTVDWFNRRWLDYTGITSKDFADNGWQLVVEPAQLSSLLQTWSSGLRQTGEIELVFSLRGRDGAFRPFLMKVVPLTDDKGEVLQWFGTHTDIASQVALEAQRREEDQRKDAFLATLAHELRNPLAPLRNGLEVLKRLNIPDPGWGRTQAMMDRQLGHVSRLLDDLLDISRIQHGKLELNRQRMSLSTALDLAQEMVEAFVINAGQSLVIEGADPTLEVHGDLFRLAQVFANLLNNAAKFSARGQKIRVSLRRVGFQVEAEVEDSGLGITSEQMPMLFDLFWQAPAQAAHARRGLGIGLSLVRSIIELHGGTISAESRGAGKGSVFRVRLPMAPARHLKAVEVNDRQTPEQSQACVLVADDNEDAAESLAVLLRLEGHRVVVALDGQQALEAAALHHPVAAILDIGMPRMDGFETCRQLRAQPFGGGMLIIALTGWGQAEDRRKTEDAGFNAHFVKPPQYEELVDLLRTVTGPNTDSAHAEPATEPVIVTPTPIAHLTIDLKTDATALAEGRLGDRSPSEPS